MTKGGNLRGKVVLNGEKDAASMTKDYLREKSARKTKTRRDGRAIFL